MSYLVLARKYRPQTFEELVGQTHVTTTLVNALEAKRLAHSYVFSGPRGCGKTTTARILAKALNCAKGPTPKPCGACDQCREIATGTSADDVLEIDGASNRGIEDIRNLRDTVKYSPARCRYRIYIIDEAHQITGPAFDALLKTLEEPPPHAVFMMATTEAQKIPATILSRSQRFQLRSISPAEIQKQLAKIVGQEKIAVPEDALAEVSRAAHGSLRDALSLLDQVIAYCPDGVKAESVRALLGLLPTETVRQFAAVLREGDAQKVLRAVQKAVEDGFDLFQFAHDLTDYWHGLFLAKSGVPSPSHSNVTEMKKDAEAYPAARLERNLQVITRCGEQMRRSESPRVTFELACLDLAKSVLSVDELVDRLEELEKALRNGGLPPPVKKKPELTAAPPPAPAPAPAASGSFVSVAALTVPPAPSNGHAAPAPAAASPENGSPLRPDQVRTAWARMVEEVGKGRPSLETFLLAARWDVRSGGVLAVVSSQDFAHQQILANAHLLRDALSRHLAGPFTLQCVVDGKFAPPARVAEPAEPPPSPSDEFPDEVEDEEGADETAAAPETIAPAEPFQSRDNGLGDSVAEIADLDAGLRKLVEKFPGKLKKIEAHARP